MIIEQQSPPEKQIQGRTIGSNSFLRRLFQGIGIKTIKRGFQSDNFVSGSVGWQLTGEGALEASSGTFRGTVSAAVITGSTITGGSIEIIGSGTTWFAVTTTGVSNLRTALASSWIQLNTSLGISLKGTAGTSAFPSELDLQNNNTMNDVVIYASRARTNCTTNLMELRGAGGNSNGNIAYIEWNSNSISNSGNSLKISHNGGASNNAGGNGIMVELGAYTTGYPLYLENSAVVSTNFKAMAYFGGTTIFRSDGTTPNGNLSSVTGNICFNGPNGQPFYCQSGTSWVAM